MARKFSKKDKQEQRKIFVDSLFDARKGKKFGAYQMKKSIYNKMLEESRKNHLQQKEIRNKVEAEIQNLLETVVLPKYGIKKEKSWHVHLHTQNQVVK